MKKWIRSGDQVVVIAGNDKGKFGEVISKGGDKVLVKGVNVRKRHMKPQGQNKLGQILEIEKPIHISNVKLAPGDDPKVKVKIKLGSKGEKELVYKENDKSKVYRNTLKPVNTKKTKK